MNKGWKDQHLNVVPSWAKEYPRKGEGWIFTFGPGDTRWRIILYGDDGALAKGYWDSGTVKTVQEAMDIIDDYFETVEEY